MDPGESDLRCGACGVSLRAQARFCDACGAPVDASGAAAERKQITVLFADVVGSMKLAATLDTERWRDIMGAVFNQSAAVVQRYQGTVDKFTGDGLMAVFGAPTALENHALCAGLAALEIQSVARTLADELRMHDDVELQLRIGLNSGEVIAGEFGSGPGSYTVIGQPVGMAQRMETAATAGGVLCSESTSTLIQASAVLGPDQWVTVKGETEPVLARPLVSVVPEQAMLGRDEGPLIGRDREVSELEDAFVGETTIVGIVGEPGVGKSRLIREFHAIATRHSAEVVVTRCESHTAGVPLHVLSRLLRAMFDVRGLDRATTRERVASRLRDVSDVQPGDADVVFDLLAVGDPDKAESKLSALARRHRLVEVMAKYARNRLSQLVIVIEDLHWVDAASDDVLASFAEAMADGHWMLIGTFRPEYRGRLREMGQSTLTLAPLDGSATEVLAAGLLGRRSAENGVATRIAQHAAGNPFFVEETVRDLVGRGLLDGNRGDYRAVADLQSISVPPTVQSVLAARIDRLGSVEKSVLNVAAVVGSSFDLDVLESLRPGVASEGVRGLVAAELIDQTQLVPFPRYRFRHPLVRTVAYESQLSATRSATHRLTARAIEIRSPNAANNNSALIAQHLEAAGDSTDAYHWYLRSAEWLMHRDIKGARDCWERARAIADALPAGTAGTTEKRIEPRARLALTEWIVGGSGDGERFVDELRSLTATTHDVLPLALAMSGRVTSLILHDGRVREAAAMAAELGSLYDDGIAGTATERAEVLMAVGFAQYSAGKLSESLQTVDRLLSIGSGLLLVDDVAPALAMAGAIKILIGRRADGQRDLDTALRVSREAGDTLTFAIVWGYRIDSVLLGFDLVDQALLDNAHAAVSMAETLGDAYGLALTRYGYGMALLRSDKPRRTDGLRFLQLSRSDNIDMGGSNLDADIAAESLRHGKVDDEQLEILADDLLAELRNGDVLFVGQAIATLVRLLAHRQAPGDVDQATDIVVLLETELASSTEPSLQLWPLLCRALLADALGDDKTFRAALAEYRDLAVRLDAHGHIAEARQLAVRTV
jgi:adenylate cyclase